MLRAFSKIVFATIALGAASTAATFCSCDPGSYVNAMAQDAELANALKTVASQGIATWYTDNGGHESSVESLLSTCTDPSHHITIVVYGLPNKDCAAGYSNNGVNQNQQQYVSFLQGLADAVGDRPVVYIFEPDAIGLLAKDDCAKQSGYLENMAAGLQVLTSSNPNADVYADVGYWTLTGDDQTAAVASAMKDLVDTSGCKVKGITLNTSNYRPNAQMSTDCQTFKDAYAAAGGDSSEIGCIVDTSRNYNQQPDSDEWCNANFGGIGHPPTDDTGYDNLDYFVWAKVPGESDGQCVESKDAMSNNAPPAGQFYPDFFKQLWDNGYFVQDEGAPAIGAGGSYPTPAPSSPQDTPTAAPSNPPQTPTATPTSAPTAAPSTAPSPPASDYDTSTSNEYTDAPATSGPASTPAPTTPLATPAPAPATTHPVTEAPVTTAPATSAPAHGKDCDPQFPPEKNDSNTPSPPSPPSTPAATDAPTESPSAMDATPAPTESPSSMDATPAPTPGPIESDIGEDAAYGEGKVESSSTGVHAANTQTSGHESDASFGGGAIAGLIGAAAVVAAVIGAAVFRHSKQKEEEPLGDGERTPVGNAEYIVALTRPHGASVVL